MAKGTTSTAKGSGKCPVAFALDTFGDKWSLLILRDIFFKRKSSYGEFLAAPEKISTNILAARLAKLEESGIITKNNDPDHLSKYIYSPTKKGEDLLPLLLDMIEWSAKYDPQPHGQKNIIDGGPDNLLSRARKDRAGLLAEIMYTTRSPKPASGNSSRSKS